MSTIALRRPLFARLSIVAFAFATLGLVGALVAATPADAATADHFRIGTFSCPGNTMVVSRPWMSSLNGDTENAKWYVAIQQWNGSSWVSYKSAGNFNGVANASGTSGWVYPSGQPMGTTLTFNVDPGYWSGGRYYYRYYRAVNWVEWTNLNDQVIAGWYGGYVSAYYADPSATYCLF